MKSFGKINVTLRVTGKRENGYHDLCSSFLKIDAGERLQIEPHKQNSLQVTGAQIQGVNILDKVLQKLNSQGIKTPPLKITLKKNVPPETGLGCGSGNAAALIEYLFKTQNIPIDPKFAASIGADIPFFLQEAPIAKVSGIGEIIDPLPAMASLASSLQSVLIIPTFRSSTPKAFAILDEKHQDSYTATFEEAQKEMLQILAQLKEHRFVGLLPNDFTPILMNTHPVYDQIFDELAQNGAIAWGISGSGSGAFGLWKKENFKNFTSQNPSIEKIIITQPLS